MTERTRDCDTGIDDKYHMASPGVGRTQPGQRLGDDLTKAGSGQAHVTRRARYAIAQASAGVFPEDASRPLGRLQATALHPSRLFFLLLCALFSPA